MGTPDPRQDLFNRRFATNQSMDTSGQDVNSDGGYFKDVFGNVIETDAMKDGRRKLEQKTARDARLAAGKPEPFDKSDAGQDGDAAANFEGSANGVKLANAATTTQTGDATDALLRKQQPANTGSRRGSFLTGPGSPDVTLGAQPALGSADGRKPPRPALGGMTADDLTNFLRTRGW